MHPKKVKMQTACNIVKTARSISSNKYRERGREKTKEIAERSGNEPYLLSNNIFATMSF